MANNLREGGDFMYNSICGCDNISKLRAYTRNDGKIIHFLRYQKKYRELEVKRNEQDALIKDIKRRQSSHQTH